MQTFIMDFNVSGMMRQKIMITRKGWTPEMVVEGLNDGRLETTLGHDGVETASETITDLEGNIIGRIQLQRSVEGLTISNFADSTDLDLDMLGSDTDSVTE